jgi:hypothetical protein
VVKLRLASSVTGAVAGLLSCVSGSLPGHCGETGHPTQVELGEEVGRADLVVRGRVVKVVDEKVNNERRHQQFLRISVKGVYKGKCHTDSIVITNFYGQRDDTGDDSNSKRQTGDDVIAFVNRLAPLVEKRTPYGQPFWLITSFLYVVRDHTIAFPVRLGEDLEHHKGVQEFVTLIEKAADMDRRLQRKENQEQYVPRKVLFLDDFNDGSMSGWTLLKGTRPNFMAEGRAWKNQYGASAGMTGQLARDRAGHLTGERDGTHIQIGVYDGRLRLRSNRMGQQVTAVAGDPNWSNYQVDVDMYHHRDIRIDKPTLISESSYKNFGVFGRVTVPRMPNTDGEDCEIGVEFGKTGHGHVTMDSVGSNAIQIRLKCPDVRHPKGSAEQRTTKILDFRTYEVPDDRAIHVTAKFMARRVEGWIDGKKYVEGLIPESTWAQFQHGRLALWAETTYAEFDNVKVTELVKKEPESR